MADTPQTLVGNQTPVGAHPHHHHPHVHHTGKRFRHFLRPDGRKVHIAGSPDEAEHLRKTLSTIDKDADFDLVIHGSPEHIEALRHTHAHHEDRHRQLKEEHGDLANEFERVIRELDALSEELHMISAHAVQLDANFSKYGYSAHLRTKEGPDESKGSSVSGDGGSVFDKDQWAAERKLGETMRLYQKPIVRQYFHKGLLWRAREAQEVASYELFIDLFYVGIIAITGDSAAEHPTGESLLRFAITFVMGWKFWSDISVLIAWFDTDDILRRFSVLFILTCLLGFTTNMAAAFTETYTPLVAFYLAARLFMSVSVFWYAWQIPMVRGSMIAHGTMSLIPAALWIGSIHVKEPGRQALIWPAVALDIFGQSLLVIFQRGTSWMPSRVRAYTKKAFEFFPATNIEHRIERTNAFVTLVFGSCVLGLLYQSNVPFGINAFFGKAVLGLIQAFTFNWLYFEIDSFNLHTHAIRRHVVSAMIWFSIHLPFIMSFVLSASALAVLVRAHDCEDAPVDSLYETFIPRSEEHLEEGLRWFYCGGLGIALACMGVIAYCHSFRSIPNRRLGKNKCLLFRFLVSIIIILLPLAKEHLNSLELIATTTGLVLFVLFLELVGATLAGQNILWDSDCRKKCEYSAKCSVTKKELEASMKEGTVLNVEEIAKKEKGEVGVVGQV
ncbi:bacterial low temperature requirement A protein-domain-containing protein [Clohesyomyces aquaticus]|uniref:Bacterial low temperature requirement A protein-domain-containing protein n=1 Tax=Clohesyomyces aquaticus TaxID=1231657 RepID=A0A1Y2A6T1_9PLEO|nr:bacterial low temperature requirement A protein-domain-containing protein [Clohesyomyces aquaticus]